MPSGKNTRKPASQATRRNGAEVRAAGPLADTPPSALSAALPQMLPAEIRAALVRLDIPLPVRFVPASRESPDSTEARRIEDCGNGIFLVYSSPAAPRHKVHDKGDEWSCSCKAWIGRRGIDCNHIHFVKQSDSAGAYACATRRDPVKLIYPENKKTEATRRANAYRDMPKRVPALFFDLCCNIAADMPHVGAPRVPPAVIAYALLMKTFRRCTYYELSALLLEDDHVRMLGWTRNKPISINTLCARLEDQELEAGLRTMIRRTARTGRQMETMVALDGSGLSTIFLSNYNEEQHGRPPRTRKKRPFVKVHWLCGTKTNLIGAVHLSTDTGAGSADAPHLRGLLTMAKSAWPGVKKLLGDKAYGNPGNYESCTALDVYLYTRARRNEDRSNVEVWGEQAAYVADLERNDPTAFDEDYRFRSKAETMPSRVKRRNSRLLLRRRKADAPFKPFPTMPDKGLCELPDEKLEPILSAASRAVGQARINEALAMVIEANVREIVMLEKLHDDNAHLRADFTFEPIRTVNEAELRKAP